MTVLSPPSYRLSPRAHLLWAGLSLAWLSWLLLGCLPVTPLEGDEIGVIHGATALGTGEQRAWDLRYLYEIQPGSYVVISRVAQLCHVSIEGAFATLTAGGALLFAAGTAWFVHRLVGGPWPVAAMAVFLTQEIWAGAYYMNTTAVGGWVAMLALLLALPRASWGRSLAVAGLLAVAGWIRIDCLLVSPAVVALSWRRHRNGRLVFREVAPLAALSLALWFGLNALSHVSWSDVRAAYASREAHDGWMRTLSLYGVVTSATVGVLSVVGLLLMAWRRDWALLLLWVGGVALSFAVYGRTLASTKYLYLATPFFVLAAVFAAREIVARWSGWPRVHRILLGAALAGLLLYDTALGVLTSSYRLYPPGPTLVSLAKVSAAGRTIELTLGGGELLATTDGYRMRGGTLLAPLAWTRDKTDLIRTMQKFSAEALQAPGDSAVFVGDWLGYQLALRELIRAGFAFGTPFHASAGYPFAGDWQRGAKRVHLEFLAYTRSPYFVPGRVPTNPAGRNAFFLGALGDHGALAELDDGLHWRLQSPALGFAKLHRRD